MVWDHCQFGDSLLGLNRLLWWKFWLVISKRSLLKPTSQFCGKLIHVSCRVTFSPFQAFLGMKIDLTLVSPGYFGKLCCICDLLGLYYISVKKWACSLWVEIFVNLGIHFLVWPAFCHGNFGKFYLKPYP